MRKIWLFLIIIFIAIIYLIIPNKYRSILNMVDQSFVGEVKQLSIYGKYFNLEGIVKYNLEFEKLDLVLKSKKQEIIYNLEYSIKDNLVEFKTNNFINEGINLEKVEVDNYVILLRVIKNDNISYYNLINKSNYPSLTYYTITHNNHRNLINISFSKNNSISFMKLEGKLNVSRENVCDVVIDPGHGGGDFGAVNGKYLEKDFNLDYAKRLYDKLTQIGLKVRLTRESDALIPPYGPNSRTAIPYECKAKLMLSIHLNSVNSHVFDGGVEIYMANGAKKSFAKILADNIVRKTTTTYSKNRSNRIDDGVYIRTYSEEDIDAARKNSIIGNYPIYENLDLNTTYYYFIRETGGIITKAMIDGRNKEYSPNPYYKSNHGTEAYLVELGYLSSAKDLEKIIKEKESYIEAIVESIKYYVKN